MNSNTFYISGKIGNKDIAREDLNTFMMSIKDFEWTDNNIYKPAKVVEVLPTFVPTNHYEKAQNYQPKNINFDVFYIEENKRLENFQQYKNEIENRRVQQLDKVLSKKKEFIDYYLQKENVNENSDKKDLLEAIRNNKVKIITNSNLNQKLGKYIGYLQSGQNINSNYDFTLLK